jgi:hypothetical protein
MKNVFAFALMAVLLAVASVYAAVTQAEADAAKVQADANYVDCEKLYKAARSRWDDADIEYKDMVLRFNDFEKDFKAGKLNGIVSGRTYNNALEYMNDAKYSDGMAYTKIVSANTSLVAAADILAPMVGDYDKNYAIPDYDECWSLCTTVGGHCQSCGTDIALMDDALYYLGWNLFDLEEILSEYEY